MKNKFMELLRRSQLDNYKSLNAHGVLGRRSRWQAFNSMHGYLQTLLNKRIIEVKWQHPAEIYLEEIGRLISLEMGPSPSLGEPIFVPSEYRTYGGKRKKLAWLTLAGFEHGDPAYDDFVEREDAVSSRIRAEGIDFCVTPSWKWTRGAHVEHINLVAPLSYLHTDNLTETAPVVDALVRRLIFRQTTLADEFPDYRFDREKYLYECAKGQLESVLEGRCGVAE